MSRLVKTADERGAYARSERRYAQGVVIDVDKVSSRCTVDVGETLPNGGTPVVQYLETVPYLANVHPSVGDEVTLEYTTQSSAGVYITAAYTGSGTSGGGGVNNTVHSIAKAGSAQLQGDVTLTGGSGVTLTESGQDISIAATAASPHALLDGSIDNDTVAGAPVAGDLIYASASPLWTKRAIGSSGQVLTVVGGLPTWAAAPAGTPHALLDGSVDSDTVAATVHKGDLVIGNGTPKWDRLPIGASGTILKSVGGTAVWSVSAASTHDLLDGITDQDTEAHSCVKGDIIYGDGSNLWQGLAIGSAGEVLGISGGVPAWQAPETGKVAITSAAGGTFTVGATDSAVLVYSETNAWTIALPNPTTCRGRIIEVLDAYQGASAGCTLSTATGVIIGPAGANGATYAMGNSGTSRNCARLMSDGSNWQVLSWTTNN